MRKYICVNIYKQKKHGIESCKCSKRHGVTAQEVDNSILLSANMGHLFELSWEIDDKRA